MFEPSHGVWQVLDRLQDFIDKQSRREVSDYNNLPDLAFLSDDDLKREVDKHWFESGAKYCSTGAIWLWAFYWAQMLVLLKRITAEWYSGDNANAFAELLQGGATPI
jgi:hypothetical protein